MIHYDVGTFHIGFIWRIKGATFMKATIFAFPAALLSGIISLLIYENEAALHSWGIDSNLGQTQAWNALNITLGLLLATRVGQALSRFWEGNTLVHQMSAEWYDAVSSLIAFSHAGKSVPMVKDFQHTLVRVISLMHGSALHQCKESHNEEFHVLGASDLDQVTLDYLAHCRSFNINRVEVLLHWVHELVTSSIGPDVLWVPPPILSRVYQELSRGIVNLNDARKITETPFPFPLAQVLVILLLADTLVIPIMIAVFVESVTWSMIMTFICTLSMWSVNIIAGELEQPFGNDTNDLPLAMLQQNFNKSLVVLLDPRAQRAPGLKGYECTQRIEVQSAKMPMSRALEDSCNDSTDNTVSTRNRIVQFKNTVSILGLSMKSALFGTTPSVDSTQTSRQSELGTINVDSILDLHIIVPPRLSITESMHQSMSLFSSSNQHGESRKGSLGSLVSLQLSDNHEVLNSSGYSVFTSSDLRGIQEALEFDDQETPDRFGQIPDICDRSLLHKSDTSAYHRQNEKISLCDGKGNVPQATIHEASRIGSSAILFGPPFRISAKPVSTPRQSTPRPELTTPRMCLTPV